VILPHDADPTASGESVKGGCYRARCTPIHEDDPVAPIGSSKQRLESGRGLRPPVTCDHDDSCDRCSRHESKLTSRFSSLWRSNRCVLRLVFGCLPIGLFIGTCWWTGRRKYSRPSHRLGGLLTMVVVKRPRWRIVGVADERLQLPFDRSDETAFTQLGWTGWPALLGGFSTETPTVDGPNVNDN